jgi:uncharacterized membrane protein YdjX (TVP38/TMEM64 family)
MEEGLEVAIIWTLLVMLTASHVGERAGVSRSLLRACLGVLAGIALVTYLTGAHEVLSELGTALFPAEGGAAGFPTPARILATCRSMQKVAQGRSFQFTVLITLIYLALQTFCIPGTVVLNAVLGSVLGVPIALPLCVFAGTVGASCCYILSSAVGSKLAEAVDRKFGQGKGIAKLRAQVTKFRSELFSYLLFLRLTPFLPNWLINLASPIVNVPLRTFALATLFGITPQTYLAVRFGTLLNASTDTIVSRWDTLLIALIGVMVLVISKLKKRFAAAQGGGGAASSGTGVTGSGGPTSASGGGDSPNTTDRKHPTTTTHSHSRHITI